MVPGHEIIGDIVAVGTGEKTWNVGDRVGGGWHGGHDGILFSLVASIHLLKVPFRQERVKHANVAFFRLVKTKRSTV